jgi:hypothetical protein
VTGKVMRGRRGRKKERDIYCSKWADS